MNIVVRKILMSLVLAIIYFVSLLTGLKIPIPGPKDPSEESSDAILLERK